MTSANSAALPSSRRVGQALSSPSTGAVRLLALDGRAGMPLASSVSGDLVARLRRQARLPLSLLPAPAGHVPAVLRVASDLETLSPPIADRPLLRVLREAGLFWPLPQAGAIAPEVLLLDDGTLDVATVERRCAGSLAAARTAVLSLKPHRAGPGATWARRRGIAVVATPSAIDPAVLRLVVGSRLQPVALWAALGGIAVDDGGIDGGMPPEAGWAERLLGLGAGRDPWTGEPVSVARAVEILAFLRERLMANGQPTMTFGMSTWKFSVVRPFLAGVDHGARSRNCADLDEAVERARRFGGRVAAWGNRDFDLAERRCAAAGVPLLRIEDGFVRSVGLGLQRSPPASLVIDAGVSYFDSIHVSVLETLLQTTEFTPALIARAAALRTKILSARLTKYNVGGHDSLPAVEGRRRVLVPGQVEGDQSLTFGSPRIRTNAALLEAARARNPDAFILFKPHPDVLTGLRPGGVPAEDVARLADAVVNHVDMATCLDWADEVETMTSLTGFEALLRGKAVTAHGMPFYAGWGLTTDMVTVERRTRRLTLDELVAATLILNPLYIDPVSGLPAEPELVVRRLDEAMHRRPTLLDRARFLYRAGMSMFAHKIYARFERHR